MTQTTSLHFDGPAPKIKQVMTPFPFFIQSNHSVADGLLMMEKHSIHHLPVQKKGELIGIVSSRELEAADRSAYILEIMKPDILIVDMDQPLDGVLEIMMREHLGSAIVRHDDKLAGIFTTFDACRLLASAFLPTSAKPGWESA